MDCVPLISIEISYKPYISRKVITYTTWQYTPAAEVAFPVFLPVWKQCEKLFTTIWEQILGHTKLSLLHGYNTL